MKRSPLPRAKAPIKRSAIKRKPPRRKSKARMSKIGWLISKAISGIYGPYHYDYIAAMPCLIRGVAGHKCKGKVRGHHVKHVSNGGRDYANEVPLCDCAHTGDDGVHVMGKRTWEKRFRVSLKAEAERLAEGWDVEHNRAKVEIW